MAKTVHNDILDAALSYISTNCDLMIACSAQPLNYTEAVTTYALADVAMTGGDFTGPADGDVSGRKITVNAKSGVTVDVEGNPLVIALVDTGTTKLLYTTDENTAQTIYVGNTVNFPAWDIELEDPA